MSRDAIAELVHAYCDAVIHRDVDRWAACWAIDARWTLTDGRTAHGREAIVELWQRAIGAYEIVIQQASSGTVRLDGARGTGRWHVSEHNRRTDGTTGLLLAYYDDEYVHEYDAWRFAGRALTVLYKGPPDLSAPFQHPEGQ